MRGRGKKNRGNDSRVARPSVPDPHVRGTVGRVTKDDLVRQAMALTVSRKRNAPAPMSSPRVTRRLVDGIHERAVGKATAQAPTPSRPSRASRLSFGSLAETPRAKTDKARTEPLEKSPDKVREERGPTCKERPKNNRGNGGSRRFVPWCDRKK